MDRYADRASFGVATFDGMPTYAGAGELVPAASFPTDSSTGAMGEYSYAGGTPPIYRRRPDGSAVGASLRAVRPFGGTPSAAAFDDLSFAYSSFTPAAASKQYVLFFTDGHPDDDFRQYPVPGCNCAAEGTCPPEDDPAQMACPYPTAEDAARHLRCGFDAARCCGPVSMLIIVALGVSDPVVRSSLEAVAAAGGGQVLYAGTEAELHDAAGAAMDLIVADAAH